MSTKQDVTARQAEVARLRADGMPVRKIAERLGAGVATITRDIAALRERDEKPADQLQAETARPAPPRVGGPDPAVWQCPHCAGQLDVSGPLAKLSRYATEAEPLRAELAAAARAELGQARAAQLDRAQEQPAAQTVPAPDEQYEPPEENW